MANKPKLLIFIVAYQASSTIQSVIQRIPVSLSIEYEVELLIIDDASTDNTFEICLQARDDTDHLFPIHILHNPINQGYGGNQKIGFHYAIENSFDYVALVHGDGQYAPELLPELVQPLKQNQANAVFGSRMLKSKGALEGGMPLYKFIGNKVLTFIQNRLLNSNLSEFHSGYRIYAVSALKLIPFELNTKDFYFDTEIIIQLMVANQRILELPIPTYYGDEICRVDGIKYAWQVVRTTFLAKTQQYNFFYDRKFDCAPIKQNNAHYALKLNYKSPHSLTINKLKFGQKVLDIGCAGGYVSAELKRKGCKVTGIDIYPLADGVILDDFHQLDINNCELPSGNDFDYFIALDVIEHLLSPEAFVEKLREATKFRPDIKIIISTGNVAFFIQRLMLLLGQFNYGNRGILDKTHTRLFTYSSMRALLTQSGFEILEVDGIPAPFPMVINNLLISNILLFINNLLIKISRNLFSYQIYIIAQPRPSLEYLLQSAENISEKIRTNLSFDD